jgi:cation diffusion facilitator family transporter
MPNSTNVLSTAKRQKSIQRVLWLTLVLNLLVLVIKALVGWATGSLSLLADALHSVTDSASNVLGLVTSRLADPRPDREHPYGHQKYEAIGALGIAAFLGVACFEILQGAIARITGNGEPVNVSGPAIALTFLVLGINILVALYERRWGNRLQSNILLADARHTMGDVWITLTVIGGLFGVWWGQAWLDVALAFPVALLVFKSGWEVLRSNLPWLIDEMAVAPEEIHDLVLGVPGVVNCHDIASRGALGRQVFMEMHLIVEAEDVRTAHDITEAVERVLCDRYHPVRLTIHIEPQGYQSDRLTYSMDSVEYKQA